MQSLKTLVERIFTRRQQQQLSAVETYRQLLSRQEALSDADESALETVIAELGLSPEQVALDAATVARILTLEAEASEQETRTIERREAQQAVAAHADEWRREEVRWDQEHKALVNTASMAATRAQKSADAANELKTLRRQHPQLFP